ncbi:MAG TPA: hypothetical protein VF599_13525 [Pyrinomonadaceae bacterium]|jgi:hypothetical protein
MKTRSLKIIDLSLAARGYGFPAIAFLFLIYVPAFVCAAQDENSRIRISRIQARIFYNNTGAFSEDAIGGNVDLWNTPFDSSYSTLVIVELDGVPEYLKSDIRVEFAARYIPFDRVKGVQVVRQVETIRNGSENGKIYVAFWLKKTGCNPVRLAARIVGRKQRFRETINFGCGE